MAVEAHWTTRDGRFVVRGLEQDIRVGRRTTVLQRNGAKKAILIGRVIGREHDTYHDEDVVLALPMREWMKNPCSRCGSPGGTHAWAGSWFEEGVFLFLCLRCYTWAVEWAVIAEERDRPPALDGSSGMPAEDEEEST